MDGLRRVVPYTVLLLYNLFGIVASSGIFMYFGPWINHSGSYRNDHQMATTTTSTVVDRKLRLQRPVDPRHCLASQISLPDRHFQKSPNSDFPLPQISSANRRLTMLRLLVITICIGLLSTFTDAATKAKATQKKATDQNDNKGI